MHEWYNKKVVYIGDPNQTRHLDAHHKIKELYHKAGISYRNVLIRAWQLKQAEQLSPAEVHDTRAQHVGKISIH